MKFSNDDSNLHGEVPRAGKGTETAQFAAPVRYGLAIVSIGAALGAGLFLQTFHFRVPAASLLLFAVATVSWCAGPGPAVLAVILATVSCYWFFVEPVRTIYINPSEIPFFVIFTGFAVLLCWFGAVRRRVEAELRASEERFRTLVQFSFDVYWESDAQHRFTRQEFSEGVADAPARGSEIGKRRWEIPYLEPDEEAWRQHRATMDAHLPFRDFELARPTPDGGKRYVSVSGLPVFDEAGRFLGYRGVGRHITERKRAEEELRRLNRELRAISDCNQALLRATDEPTLLKDICRIVCEEAGYRMAWVGYVEHDEAKTVRPVAWAGTEEGYLTSVGITWADTVRGRGPTGMAIRSRTSCCIQDFATDPRLAPWRENVLQRGFRSGIALPLKDEHANAFGSLTIHSTQPNAFTAEEIRLLEELAADLAFGIVTLRSAAARKRAEEALRRSEAYLTEAQRLTRTGSWAYDPAGGPIYWSEEMFRIYAIDPLHGLPTRAQRDRQIHPEDLEIIRQARHKLLHEKVDFDFEHRIVLPDGKIRHVHVRGRPVLSPSGEVLETVGTTVDITERKYAEEALRQSQSYLVEAERLSHTGSWAFDVASDRYFYASEECARIFEFDGQQDLPSREAISRLIHPEDWPGVNDAFEKTLREKSDTASEFRITLPSGTVKHVHAIRHPILNDAGEVGKLIGTVIDMTERKRAEEKVRHQERELQHLLDFAPQQVAVFGPDRSRLYANRPTLDYFGVTLEEWSSISDPFWFFHPDDRERVAKDVYTGNSSGAPHEFEGRLRRKDGVYRWFLFRDNPMRDEYGHIMRWYISGTDIEDWKQAQQALQESEANLNRAQEIAHVGSWHLDLARNQLTWSNEVYRLFGTPIGTPLGYDAFLGMIHPEDRERVDRAWAAALKGAPYDIEHRILVGDELKWVRERAVVEFDPTGKAVKGTGTVQDITERKRAEEERRESAERFRAIADYTYDWESWVGNDGALLWLNPAVERITGYSVDECMVMPGFPMPIIAAPDRERVARQTDEAVRGSSRNDVEFRVRHKDGRLVWVAASWQPIYDSRGARLGHRSSIRDIAERKQAEDALRRSEAYLAEAQRLSRTGSWAFDLSSNKYVYASEECVRIFELDAQEGLRTREAVSRQIHPQDWDRVKGEYETSLCEKVDTSSEFRIVLPDGTVKHIHTIRHPVLNGAGEVVQLVGTVIDITEGKRAEDALRESEMRFRTFVDHAADAFFMLDFEQGTILDVNRCACETLGYAREELIGMDPMAFHLEADRAQMESVAERVMAGDTVFDRHWHRRKDGSLFPVEVQTSLFWHGGRRFLLKVARDISDRVRAEKQRDRLRELEADLAHINRVSMLGELTASIAHEVNQPLAGVVSNAGASLRWLAGDPPNLEKAREAASRIVRDGKRAGEIIARVRALTRRAATTQEKLDLNQTVQEVLALVQDEVKRNCVSIQTQFAGDLSPVPGDRVQLQQVVLNLVMNGIEAMSGVGERARELVVTTRNVEPDQVQVTVEDSGTGLDPGAMDKIFDPFYTTKPGGMGMGLSICRSILQSHGGRLWATAKDGPGTSFHFTLPKYHEDESHA